MRVALDDLIRIGAFDIVRDAQPLTAEAARAQDAALRRHDNEVRARAAATDAACEAFSRKHFPTCVEAGGEFPRRRPTDRQIAAAAQTGDVLLGEDSEQPRFDIASHSPGPSAQSPTQA